INDSNFDTAGDFSHKSDFELRPVRGAEFVTREIDGFPSESRLLGASEPQSESESGDKYGGNRRKKFAVGVPSHSLAYEEGARNFEEIRIIVVAIVCFMTAGAIVVGARQRSYIQDQHDTSRYQRQNGRPRAPKC